jgi:hypothetical protein
MKNKIFDLIKEEAKRYAAQFKLSFYEHFAPEISYAREIFFDHPLLLRCAEDVLPFLNDNFGHGVEHSKKVAIEAGALVMIEFFYSDPNLCRHMVILAELCGLLHDTCRLEPDHAKESAYLAMKILRDFPLSDGDKEMIFYAIINHEAFRPISPPPNHLSKLLSGALYDADKFRWGPDNFTTTLWEICDYQEWSIDKIIKRFPKGLEIIKSISDSFRTNTGQIYGPEFIEAGIKIGNFIYQKLVKL